MSYLHTGIRFGVKLDTQHVCVAPRFINVSRNERTSATWRLSAWLGIACPQHTELTVLAVAVCLSHARPCAQTFDIHFSRTYRQIARKDHRDRKPHSVRKHSRNKIQLFWTHCWRVQTCSREWFLRECAQHMWLRFIMCGTFYGAAHYLKINRKCQGPTTKRNAMCLRDLLSSLSLSNPKRSRSLAQNINND